MKKVINQKRYDTDTAKKIADYQYSTPGDFNWWSETLYQKKTGEYFLHGEGGPMSRYAEQTGQNEWSGSERLIPLDYDSAREWAEQYMDAGEYESQFGAVQEDDSVVSCNFYFSASTQEVLRREASRSGKSMSSLAEEAILKTYKK